MQLDPAEKRSVWWKGALKSGFKETLRGCAIGFVAAAVLFGVGLISASFATLVAPMVGLGSFSPLLLTAFCGVISGVTGLFTGGSQAVDAYHQQKHNLRDEAKLIELDGRTRTLEQTVTMTPSRNVQKILDNGSRHAPSFEAAEAARKAETPATPALH